MSKEIFAFHKQGGEHILVARGEPRVVCTMTEASLHLGAISSTASAEERRQWDRAHKAVCMSGLVASVPKVR